MLGLAAGGVAGPQCPPQGEKGGWSEVRRSERKHWRTAKGFVQEQDSSIRPVRGFPSSCCHHCALFGHWQVACPTGHQARGCSYMAGVKGNRDVLKGQTTSMAFGGGSVLDDDIDSWKDVGKR